MYDLQIKRVYEKPDINDGYRILIDRLWPRGMRKDEARLDDWAKSITPSTEIRKAFAHDPAKMGIFRGMYISELNQNPAADEFLTLVAEKLRQINVTLLYGAKNEKYNHAVILKDWIKEKLP
jgi:uncharacterized protein YeaO (DUF488 family)